MKKLLKERTGEISIFAIGLIFVLMMITILVMEMGGTIEQNDYVLSVLQRSCNSAVEKNILDDFRADHTLKLDVDQAKADFRTFVQNDIQSKYTIVITEITCQESPPTMTVKGTMTFPTMFSPVGFEDFTTAFQVTSTNYDLDG